MSRHRLLIRADAGASTGLGHIGRAYALAEELGSRLGATPELLARPDPVLERFLDGRAVIMTAVDSGGYALDEVLGRLSPGAILISDTYDLDEQALEAVAATGARHVVIDDFARLPRWPVEVVVNPNAGSEGLRYPEAAHVLAGTRYALLRREVRAAARSRRRRDGPAQTVLVSLGGGLWPERGLELLQSVVRELPGVTVGATIAPRLAPRGVEALESRLLPAQLAAADVALLSGGVIKYEAAACGLPALLVAVVPHQVEVAATFAATGAARALGALADLDLDDAARCLAALALDAPARAAISAAARAAVDGRGAARAAERLLGPV